MINFLKRNNKAFTLIELMIVIAIIGILAMVLIPKAMQSKTVAKESGTVAVARSVQTTLEGMIDNYTIPGTASASAIAAFSTDIMLKINGLGATNDAMKSPFSSATGASIVITTSPGALDSMSTALDAGVKTTGSVIILSYTPVAPSESMNYSDAFITSQWALSAGRSAGNSNLEGRVVVVPYVDSAVATKLKCLLFAYGKDGVPLTLSSKVTPVTQ